MKRVEIPGSARLSAKIIKDGECFRALCKMQREYGQGMGLDYHSVVEFTEKRGPLCDAEDAARDWTIRYGEKHGFPTISICWV